MKVNHVDTIEQRVNRRWEQLGFESLLPEEKGYVATWLLVSDVNNGGFEQYLTNNTGDLALVALDALRSAGASETQAILEEALSILEAAGGYCADRAERWSRIESLPLQGAELDGLDKRFYSRSEEPLTLILVRVAEAYGHDIGTSHIAGRTRER